MVSLSCALAAPATMSNLPRAYVPSGSNPGEGARPRPVRSRAAYRHRPAGGALPSLTQSRSRRDDAPHGVVRRHRGRSAASKLASTRPRSRVRSTVRRRAARSGGRSRSRYRPLCVAPDEEHLQGRPSSRLASRGIAEPAKRVIRQLYPPAQSLLDRPRSIWISSPRDSVVA